MTSLLPGFDTSLHRRLEDSARDAGENISTYVARAVAAQMVADRKRGESASVQELAAKLVQSGFLFDTADRGVTAVLADPERLSALYATGLLDSLPEETYDRITRAAADALHAPSAALPLVDVNRQFFKSTVGMNVSTPEGRQTSLDQSFCKYAVASGDPLIVEDAVRDPLFKDHPKVRAGVVASYLGIPLIDFGGNAIGTLCVFDEKPRTWGTGHVQILGDLAAIASERIFGRLVAPLADGAR